MNKILELSPSLVLIGENWGIIEFLDLAAGTVVLRLQIKSTIEGFERVFDNHISDMVFMHASLCLGVATNNGMFLIRFTRDDSDNSLELLPNTDHHLQGVQIKTLQWVSDDTMLLGLTLESAPKLYSITLRDFLECRVDPPSG